MELPLRILVVDDDRVQRTQVSVILGRDGHPTSEASDGNQALEALMSCPGEFALILLDLVMPGMSGLEFLRARQADWRLREIPVIVVTAEQDKATRREALEAGAQDYLTRPVDDVELRVRVRNLVALRQRATQLQDLVAMQARQLDAAERLWHDVLDALPAHIAVVDERRRIVRVNESWRSFTAAQGHPQHVYRGAEGEEYLPHRTGSLPDDADRQLRDGIDLVLEGGLSSFSLEYECEARSGRRWYLGRATPLGKGRGLRVVVSHEDITDFERTERSLATREEEYRALVQAVPDTIMLLGRGGTIRYANRALPGFDKAGAIGKSAFALLDDMAAATLRETIEEALLSGEVRDCEFVGPGESGTQRYYANRVTAFGPAEDPCVLVVCRDVTGRRDAIVRLERAQQATRLSEERELQHLRGMQRLSEMALAVLALPLDEDFLGLLADRLSELLGEGITVATGEVVGDRLWLRHLRADSVASLEQEFGELPRIPGLVPRSLLDLLAHDLIEVEGGIDGLGQHGALGLVLERLAELRSVQSVYVAGLTPDDADTPAFCLLLVGEGASLDEGLLKAHIHQAAVALGRRRSEQHARHVERQLRQSHKLEAIGKLAGGVAHDFNNLLTSIIGFTQIVREQLPEGSDEAVDLGEVLIAAERACGLTNQLLAFSRQQPVDPRLLDLNDELMLAVKLLRRTIGEDVQLIATPAERPAVVRADPTQVAQLLLNLAVNARDAMVDGGVLRISLSRCDLLEGSPSDLPTGDYVELVVTDTGHGMDDETLTHVFEPFFTTKGGAGTGLGLSTCYGIVKQLGGAIAVSNVMTGGTRFTILLPREPDGVVATPVPEALDESALPEHACILVVEDDLTVRSIAKRILSGAGYQVIVAADGDEAVAELEQQGGRINLMFSDIVLPRLSGYELSDLVAERYPEIRVLLTSGYFDRERKADSTDYPLLWKPYTQAQLLDAIRRALGGSSRVVRHQEA